MIEDVVEGIFKIVGRFIVQIFLEIVFEILIKGPGYFISRLLTKHDPNPDGFAVVIAGILFWVVIGFGFHSMYLSGGGHT